MGILAECRRDVLGASMKASATLKKEEKCGWSVRLQSRTDSEGRPKIPQMARKAASTGHQGNTPRTQADAWATNPRTQVQHRHLGHTRRVHSQVKNGRVSGVQRTFLGQIFVGRIRRGRGGLRFESSDRRALLWGYPSRENETRVHFWGFCRCG
jgi:hypothetical protein